MRNRRRGKSDERGFLMFDFMFALIFAFGFSAVFFAVTLSLALFEVAQYVTFSTSRVYAPAFETEEARVAAANQKFDELMSAPVLKALFGQGWMEIKKSGLKFGDFSDDYQPDAGKDTRIFVGARLAVDAKMLRLRIPFLGSTTDDTKVGKAVLNSYLMREVTTRECRENFTAARFTELKKISPYNQVPNTAKEALVTDNGC